MHELAVWQLPTGELHHQGMLILAVLLRPNRGRFPFAHTPSADALDRVLPTKPFHDRPDLFANRCAQNRVSAIEAFRSDDAACDVIGAQ
jgi:hypothetical protein